MPSCENEYCLLEWCVDAEDCNRTLGDSLRALHLVRLTERLAKFKTRIIAECIDACSIGKTRIQISSDLVGQDKFMRITALELGLEVVIGSSGDEPFARFSWPQAYDATPYDRL